MSVGIAVGPQDRPDAVLRVLLPVVAVVGTVPPALIGPAVPAASPPELVLAGGAVVLAGVGLTAVGVWRLLALGTRVAAGTGLVGAGVLLGEGLAIGREIAPAGWAGPVVGAAGGAIAGAGLLGVIVRWRHRSLAGVPAPRSVRGPLVGAGLVLLVLAVARTSVPAWLVAVGVIAVVLAGLPLLVAHVRAGTPRAALAVDPVVRPPGDLATPGSDDPYATIEVDPPPPVPAAWGPTLRVLHLAGAEPEASAELHRRLGAAGHEVTVLSPRFPGAHDRIEAHGAGMVRWTHPVRRGWTRPGRMLGYVAAAILAARDTRADVVVEELVASPGPLALPRWTTRPVVALATWLPDPEPADRSASLLRLRWWAIRSHRSVVVRSPAAADALAAARSRAHVAVVGEGIDPAALWTAPRRRGDDVVVRVGRLGAGPDVVRPLLYAWARTGPAITGRLVLIGCGAHEAVLRQCAVQLGLGEQVEFAAEPDGDARHARVAAARLAVVPPGAPEKAARAVALEALAVGTPVLGPDTPALREVVPAAVGILVPDRPDPATIAEALLAVHADRERRDAAAVRGPRLARAHDLDVLAGQIADVYLAAVTRGAMGRDGRLVRH
ncbi:glycosyltransferase involved in cell wall biosynthesis [Actinomycetospora succinea]|uniref:Glycosyltransferase involved in cell wall biosynthesis n=1 Tax=Actinomycetospora succinea TaxID=663603 RepID=A0A4R6VAS4_9PSEU|nr:glycosyltransferase family 4 protein [Actinomycetospora succinea]TDQ58775.1 glycosyltransferase involved in cell wall biosynthesis [Actinomycetospora succinea]